MGAARLLPPLTASRTRLGAPVAASGRLARPSRRLLTPTLQPQLVW